MKTPEDVVAIVHLHQLGRGSRRIARELGTARNTVKHHLREGGWKPYRKPDRVRCLKGHGEWLRAQLRKHGGSPVVVQRKLLREHGIEVTLRTVQRAVKPYRQELLDEAKAAVRFETYPARQLQVDFGQITVMPGGRKTRVHVAVMTLGQSRRVFVCTWPSGRQARWLRGFHLAFEHFGGAPPSCSWTTRGLWCSSTTRRRARPSFAQRSSPSASTGAASRTRARRTGLGRRASRSAVSATSSATRLPEEIRGLEGR